MYFLPLFLSRSPPSPSLPNTLYCGETEERLQKTSESKFRK
ncbi:Protein CBG25714 [Caenorhabditis briggsae]|uniref:Protein CBG25714 n=1 Tax=Caenorhabditis briggsae TaxID=6238 RepID=B6IGX7_CAEBR|nr:Protein CBG25714 [Caenorhabditis briggsae]CAR99157.1 Protein CBG25714 [Caenorhabditis briggsae]